MDTEGPARWWCVWAAVERHARRLIRHAVYAALIRVLAHSAEYVMEHLS
jgi:hypothetical protein